MFGAFAKLCQRQVYSWLSSRCGLTICVVGIFLVLVSALQFGEVFLEWSKESYAAQFSIYHDNIATKSYEQQLCSELPIDIVYTWVNGSDPRLIAELKELKRKIEEERVKNAPAVDTRNTTKTPTSEAPPCPFKACVAWQTLVVDATKPYNLTLEEVRGSSPLLNTTVDFQYVNSSAKHRSPVFVFRLPSEQNVSTILETGLHDTSGRSLFLARGYLTSDASSVDATRMEGVAMVNCSAIRVNNSSKLLRKWLDYSFTREVIEVEVRQPSLAVVRLKPSALETILHGNTTFTFLGEPLTLHQAYLAWLKPQNVDHSVPEKEEISSSRFEDNEELKFSLRSVEMHASWVRHIFIVTNGQIPSWLNMDNPRITLITHKEIFPNQSHLPTYSSPAIEAHLHRIPGLSKRFIYLNDDVMFGLDVYPEDFYTPRKGQKVYLSWPVPHCKEGCPPNWIRDNYCDQACNNSVCDWDGGDCTNATKPGWTGNFQRGGSQSTSSSLDHCSTGCLNTWLGDRYCDQACRTLQCGYDAGDCGVDQFGDLFSINVNASGGNYLIPPGTQAMFFNLTSLFWNGTVTVAEYTATNLIRTAVVAQKFKLLSLTFALNVSMATTSITLSGTVNDFQVTVNFTVTGETSGSNSRAEYRDKMVNGVWSFPNSTNPRSQEFLKIVSARIQSANRSVNYWVTERPPVSHVLAPPTAYTNITVLNTSALPVNVLASMQMVEKDYRDGYLTERGYLKRKAQLLEPFLNGAIHGAAPIPYVAISSPPPHGEVTFQARRLQQVSEEDVEMVNYISEAKKKELRREGDMNRAIAQWEEKHGPWDPLLRPGDSRHRFPWERYHVFPDALELEAYNINPYSTVPHRHRQLMEAFADSLRFVNRLYNQAYGYHARKVPAHMPHMINIDIMKELQKSYAEEFDCTSSHKLRASDDMQFGFSYFYFMIGERQELNIAETFREYDTDQSGILSVRELRTLMARVTDLPLDAKKIDAFEGILKNCQTVYNGSVPTVDPVEFETHYDPALPLVTMEFVERCKPLLDKINSTIKARPKYPYEETGEEDVIFQMINDNATKVLTQLDGIRKNRRKFICLNDNMDHRKHDANMAKMVLLDFYQSFYPLPSQFELLPQYRNRFMYVSELEEWLQMKESVQISLHVLCAVLLVVCVVSLFFGKVVQFKRKIVRTLNSCLRPERIRPSSV